jgi:hypothetical protein
MSLLIHLNHQTTSILFLSLHCIIGRARIVNAFIIIHCSSLSRHASHEQFARSRGCTFLSTNGGELHLKKAPVFIAMGVSDGGMLLERRKGEQYIGLDMPFFLNECTHLTCEHKDGDTDFQTASPHTKTSRFHFDRLVAAGKAFRMMER